MKQTLSLALRASIAVLAAFAILSSAAPSGAIPLTKVSLPLAPPLSIDHAMPEAVPVGGSHSVLFLIQGGNPSHYLFSVANAPDFMTWTEDGWVTLMPEAGDEGTYRGIVFSVWDGRTMVESAPFTLEVTGAAGH